MNEMIMNLGNRMVTLRRMINMVAKDHNESENRMQTREMNKFDHEFNGMVMAIKAMGIEYDFEYDDEVVEMTAITLMGIRFEV